MRMLRENNWAALVTGLTVLTGLWLPRTAVGEEPVVDPEVDAAGRPVETAELSWTPELAIRYRSISATALSADGSRVAYVVRQPEIEGEKSEFISRIRVAATDGSRDVRYTHAERSSDSPAFSPDGEYLAFLSKPPGDKEAKTQVWLMRVAGGEAEPLTEAKGGVNAFRWSPDSRSIAFIATDPLSEEEEKAKKEKRDVILVDQGDHTNHLHLRWLEPGEDGEAESRLTEGDFHVTDFDWTPDGTTLVFSHQADPRLNTGFMERDLSTVPISGGEVTPLVKRPGVDTDPLVSPDGRWVAFVSSGGTPQPVGLRDAWVVPTAGGEPSPLGWSPNRDLQLVAWSADSSAVLGLEARGTTRQIVRLPADGAATTDLTALTGAISAPSLDQSGEHLAFVWETLDAAPEVHVVPVAKLSEPPAEALSSVNSDLPRPPMGKTELVTWNSFDGLEIEGLLTTPVGYQSGRRYPLILQIHGGPAGVFSQTFTGSVGAYQTQTLAQRGYAILRPNPRGSTGYGKDFRYANIRDWGYGDYQDIMAGVDQAIDRGVADPERLFVMGWSYGGYLTSYVVTRTERFRAASMGAGLPNLVSMVHTTDIQDYLVAHMGAELWDDYAVYEKHSAMYRLAKITTPTQIIHGAEDLRVPFDQGRELYIGLQRRGVPTEMVVYPRTPHGPREPKFVMDVTPRILTWFAKHGGPGAGEQTIAAGGE